MSVNPALQQLLHVLCIVFVNNETTASQESGLLSQLPNVLTWWQQGSQCQRCNSADFPIVCDLLMSITYVIYMTHGIRIIYVVVDVLCNRECICDGCIMTGCSSQTQALPGCHLAGTTLPSWRRTDRLGRHCQPVIWPALTSWLQLARQLGSAWVCQLRRGLGVGLHCRCLGSKAARTGGEGAPRSSPSCADSEAYVVLPRNAASDRGGSTMPASSTNRRASPKSITCQAPAAWAHCFVPDAMAAASHATVPLL